MASGLVRMSLRFPWMFGVRGATTATASDTQGVQASEDLRLTFASPEKTFFTDVAVKQVDVPTMAGTVGLLARHVPILGVLKPGIVAVTDMEGNVTKKFVSSGTVAMNPDGTCQVLTEEAIDVEDIDEMAVRQELEVANRRIQEVNADIDKAEATITIEVCEALLKATTGQQ